MFIFDPEIIFDFALSLLAFWSTLLANHILTYSALASVAVLFLEHHVLKFLDNFLGINIKGAGMQFSVSYILVAAAIPVLSIFLILLYWLLMLILVIIVPNCWHFVVGVLANFSTKELTWFCQASFPPCFIFVSRWGIAYQKAKKHQAMKLLIFKI